MRNTLTNLKTFKPKNMGFSFLEVLISITVLSSFLVVSVYLTVSTSKVNSKKEELLKTELYLNTIHNLFDISPLEAKAYLTEDLGEPSLWYQYEAINHKGYQYYKTELSNLRLRFYETEDYYIMLIIRKDWVDENWIRKKVQS